MRDVLATMESTNPESLASSDDFLVEVFRTIWLRLEQRSSKETQGRFIDSMTDYCTGLLTQVEASVDPENFNLEGCLRRKCQTVATYPLYAMVGYCYGIQLNSEAIAYKSIQTIQRLSRN